MKNTIVITGTAGLIGKEILHYLKTKYYIISVDINNLESELNEDIIHIQKDITSLTTWQTVLKILNENKLNLYGLINCAAITNATRAIDQDMGSAFLRTLEVNLLAPYLAIETLQSLMINQNFGRIINFGSLYSKVAPTPRLYIDSEVLQTPGYTVSKHGIHGLTKFYAAQLIKFGITVNTLSPGGVFDNQDENFLKKYEEQNPSGRMAQPKDFIPTIECLLINENNYITGQNILIDGGWTSV